MLLDVFLILFHVQWWSEKYYTIHYHLCHLGNAHQNILILFKIITLYAFLNYAICT